MFVFHHHRHRGTSTETLTYSFAGVTAVERIGADQTQTVYVFADRLSSASLVTTTLGEKIADQRYLPFGEERWNTVDLPNDRGYTGQRNEKHNMHYVVQGFGLLDYNARFYSAYLGRFVSADSIVQNLANVKSFDRYAYVLNNPVRLVDPSGHVTGDCYYLADGYGTCSTPPYVPDADIWGVTYNGSTSNKDKHDYMVGVISVGISLSPYLRMNPLEAYKYVFGKTTFTVKALPQNGKWYCENTGDGVTCHGGSGQYTPRLFVHEFGHKFHTKMTLDKYGPENYLTSTTIYDDNGELVTGKNAQGNFKRTTSGYKSDGIPDMYHGPSEWRDDWNVGATAYDEDFADMFMNWVFDSFDYRDQARGAGKNRMMWMNVNMAEWIWIRPGRG